MVNNDFLEDFVKNFDVKFYDLEFATEFGRQIARIYITTDNNENVTLDKCSKISKALSPILDADPILNDEYILEVSSPGLERKLTSLRHYELSLGCDVKFMATENDKIIARLVSVSDKTIIFEKNDEKLTYNFDDIKKAKTYINWNR